MRSSNRSSRSSTTRRRRCRTHPQRRASLNATMPGRNDTRARATTCVSTRSRARARSPLNGDSQPTTWRQPVSAAQLPQAAAPDRHGRVVLVPNTGLSGNGTRTTRPGRAALLRPAAAHWDGKQFPRIVRGNKIVSKPRGNEGTREPAVARPSSASGRRGPRRCRGTRAQPTRGRGRAARPHHRRSGRQQATPRQEAERRNHRVERGLGLDRVVAAAAIVPHQRAMIGRTR